MAFYDWDHNGKKDIVDDYIEYNIYKECTKENDNSNSYSSNNYSNNNNYRSGKGVSNFGAGCGTVLTIIIASVISGALGLEGTPLVIVFIILCVLVGGCIAWYFDEIGF